MSIKRYSNNAWSDISDLRRYANGAWQSCDSAKAYKNNAWEIVWRKGVEPYYFIEGQRDEEGRYYLINNKVADGYRQDCQRLVDNDYWASYSSCSMMGASASVKQVQSGSTAYYAAQAEVDFAYTNKEPVRNYTFNANDLYYFDVRGLNTLEFYLYTSLSGNYIAIPYTGMTGSMMWSLGMYPFAIRDPLITLCAMCPLSFRWADVWRW